MAELDSESENSRQKETELRDLAHEIKNKISLAENEISHSESSIARLGDENSEADKRAVKLDEQIRELNSTLESLSSPKNHANRDLTSPSKAKRSSGCVPKLLKKQPISAQ